MSLSNQSQNYLRAALGDQGAANEIATLLNAVLPNASLPTITMQDGANIVLNGTTGTKIGTATTQKLAFFNSTPVVQPAGTGSVTGFVAGSGTASKSDSVWAGAAGASAYTVGDIVTAMKALGLLAS